MAAAQKIDGVMHDQDILSIAESVASIDIGKAYDLWAAALSGTKITQASQNSINKVLSEKKCNADATAWLKKKMELCQQGSPGASAPVRPLASGSTKTIQGVSYKPELLNLALDATKDGATLDVKSAEEVYTKALQDNKLTEVEFRTIEFVMAFYPMTKAAHEFLSAKLTEFSSHSSIKTRTFEEVDWIVDGSTATATAETQATPKAAAAVADVDMGGAAADSSATGGSPGRLGPPPEGVDWANRWVELENYLVNLEAERDKLKGERDKLTRERVERAVEAVSPKAAAVDSQEIEQLKERLRSATEQAEARLNEVVEERNRSSKLFEDLELKTKNLASLSSEKLQLQFDLNVAKSSVLPLENERERLKEVLKETEKRCNELREDAANTAQAKNQLFKEKLEMKRELSLQLEEARGDAKFHENVAEDARSNQENLRKQVKDKDDEILHKAEKFAQDRSEFEKKVDLQEQQLKRSNALRDSGVEQLQQVKAALEAAQASEKDALTDAQDAKARVLEVEKNFHELQREHEELVRRRVPGASALQEPPEGFSSVAELVREVSAAKRNALQANQEKEQYQDALLEVEREIRARYPALERQRSEYERLRVVSAQLTRQNEGLLVQVQKSEQSQRDKEAQAKQAKRSSQILEEHAKDMANQLGVLIVKNQRLSGKKPSLPPGITDLKALEDDRNYFHNVQDLVQQNEQLRKITHRLTEECETESQRKLTAERQAHEEELKAWEGHLAAKAEQMKAVAANIELLTHERDTAQRALKEREEVHQAAVAAAAPAAPATPLAASGSSGGKAAGPMVARGDLVPREHLTIVRDEFTKATEALHVQSRELREAEQKARLELAQVQAKLEWELSQTRSYESSRKQNEKRLEERKRRCEDLENRISGIEKNLETETERGRDREAQLAQAKRDKGDLEMQLKLERSNGQRLEHSNVNLLAEKTSQTQCTQDLQFRMTQQGEDYKGMKTDLEGAYKKAEEQLKEQLDHAKHREKDLEQTVKDVGNARAEREAEAIDARKRVAEYETINTKLQTQVAESKFECEELRAALPTRPQRGADVAAEAEAQLRKAQTPQPKAEDVAKMEQKLRFMEQRETQHAEEKRMWESVIGQHEKGTAASKDRVGELEGELQGLREQQKKHDEVAENSRQKALDLETKTFELGKQATDLQAQLEKKEAEVAAAKLDGDQKLQELRSQLATIEHKTADARDNLDDWQRKHREAVTAHAKDIQELQVTLEKSKSLETEVKELRARKSELEMDSAQAIKSHTEEVQGLKRRLSDADKHSEALGIESKRYQEKLCAFAEHAAGGANPDMERIALEMKRAREIGELQRQELELDKARAERQVKALQEEASDLEKRLVKEQDAGMKLQAEVKRNERGLAKLERLGLVEDENRRLAEEARSLQERLDEASKELEGQKVQLEPLQLLKSAMTRKEQDWQCTKKSLMAESDQWKESYNELVQKFDSLDVKELKTLRVEREKWNATKADLEKRLQQTSEDLKKASASKQSSDDLQKSLNEAQTKLQEVTRQKAQLSESSQKSTTELTKVQGLKDLGLRKIQQLEAEGQKLKDDISKHQASLTQTEQSKTELNQKIQKMASDMKSFGDAAAQSQVLKNKNEEIQKRLNDSEEKLVQSRAQQGQRVDQVKKLEAQVKLGDSHKQLRDNRIAELEAKLSEAEKGPAASAAALKKAEADLGVVRQKADRAMALAVDYQHGCKALIAKNSSLEAQGRAAIQQARAAQAQAALPLAELATVPAVAEPVSAPAGHPAVQTPVTTLPSAGTESGASTAATGVEGTTGGLGGSVATTASPTSNPFSAGAATASILFSSTAVEPAQADVSSSAKRKLSPTGADSSAEGGAPKAVKTSPVLDVGIDPQGSPPSTPAAKRAPAGLKKAAITEGDAAQTASSAAPSIAAIPPVGNAAGTVAAATGAPLAVAMPQAVAAAPQAVAEVVEVEDEAMQSTPAQ